MVQQLLLLLLRLRLVVVLLLVLQAPCQRPPRNLLHLCSCQGSGEGTLTHQRLAQVLRKQAHHKPPPRMPRCAAQGKRLRNGGGGWGQGAGSGGSGGSPSPSPSPSPSGSSQWGGREGAGCAGRGKVPPTHNQRVCNAPGSAQVVLR